MSGVLTPSRPPVREQRAERGGGLGRLVHAEWTKFSTLRGWVWGAFAAVLVTVLIGLIATTTNQGADRGSLPVGPGGEVVNDSFFFVHQSLTGDGMITAPVTSLTGIVPAPDNTRSEVQPWAKAGVIVKSSMTPGSAYAAMMLTGGHGTRMQDDFTGDVAGPAGATWVRLVRTGDTLTGFASSDGTSWTRVGSARLAGLPAAVQVGLFVTSPAAIDDTRTGAVVDPAIATGTFGNITLGGGWSGGSWAGDQLGHAGTSGSYTPDHQGGFHRTASGFTITGAGDIAPVVGGPALGNGFSIENFLVGGFAGLIAMIVIGSTFMTAEYRRNMVLLTLSATPRRPRVLVAKAVVIAAVSFVTGLIAAFIVIQVGEHRARSGGSPIFPTATGTEVRVIVGTGLLFAVAAVFALSIGTILRRSAAAVTVAIVALILPYILAILPVLPNNAENWLLRVTPAAGFAIQSSGLPRYDQVTSIYTPTFGYYPLAPWVGFGVLCLYAVAAFALATVLLRRRDA